MDLTNKSVIKNLLEKYNARPEKYLGQHFILSKNALKKMIDAAEIKKTDTVIEIGPGLGTLTQELAKTGANVIAIEKDHLMAEILKETVMVNHKNIKIVRADARQLSILRIDSFAAPQLRGEPRPERFERGDKMGTIIENNKYKIVANLPYNAATFLIRQWLESENPPELMVLMIQKEVARRIVAKPPHSNLLGVSVQFYAEAKIIDYVKKESFWPKPKVDAAIIKITPKISKKNGHIKPIGLKQSFAFFRVVKAGFSQPRKQLISNISKKLNISREKLALIFRNLNISERARAENLSLINWQELSSELTQ